MWRCMAPRLPTGPKHVAIVTLYVDSASRGTSTGPGSWRCPYFAECWRARDRWQIRSLVFPSNRWEPAKSSSCTIQTVACQTFWKRSFPGRPKKRTGSRWESATSSSRHWRECPWRYGAFKSFLPFDSGGCGDLRSCSMMSILVWSQKRNNYLEEYRRLWTIFCFPCILFLV